MYAAFFFLVKPVSVATFQLLTISTLKCAFLMSKKMIVELIGSSEIVEFLYTLLVN